MRGVPTKRVAVGEVCYLYNPEWFVKYGAASPEELADMLKALFKSSLEKISWKVCDL